MLLERQVSSFIHSSFSSQILKQIPQPFSASGCLLSIDLSLDLLKTLRKHNAIALFLIGNYPTFLKLLSAAACEILQHQRLPLPEYGIKPSMHFTNCPLPRHNIQSVSFLTASLQHQGGVLVYLKGVCVTSVYQPQMYLFCWEDLYEKGCGCGGEVVRVPNRQGLLDVMRRGELRQAAENPEEKCSGCGSKLRRLKRQNEVFLNCQKVKGVVDMKAGEKEEVFHTGAVEIYAQGEGAIKEGELMDACVYVTTSVSTSVSTSLGMNKLSVHLYLVCKYPAEEKLPVGLGVGLRQMGCDSVNDFQILQENYSLLLQSLNIYSFPYLKSDSFTLLKLSTLAALGNNLNLLTVTDETLTVSKALQGICSKLNRKCALWPTIHDNLTLSRFISGNISSVLLVINPNLKDIQVTNRLLKQMKMVIWIVVEPNRQLKRQIELQYVHICMDISYEKNTNICGFDDVVDQRLNGFMRGDNSQYHTAQKRVWNADQSGGNIINNGGYEVCPSDQEQMAHELLTKYYLRSREYKNVHSRTMENITSVAEGFTKMRGYFEGANGASMSLLDAVLSIFVQEESCRVKYSSCNTLFANEVSKLMLNESDCELSFWEYQLDQNMDIGEIKRKINRKDMFRRMVTKMVMLLYEQEV